MFEIEIATSAPNEKLPSLPVEAPPSAVVVIVSVLVALIVRSWTPVRSASFAMPAVVVSLTTCTATEAPMPDALPSVACFAFASALFSKFDVAFSVRFPLTATGVGLSMTAVASATTMLTETEPATPMLLPPAPEVELVENVDLSGAVTSRVTPVAVRLAFPATYALVVMTATLTATATAIPELVSLVGIAPEGVAFVLSTYARTLPRVASSCSWPLSVPR